jgi:predicted enzyme involved in methoxymalonyl-ACP biosynthesis
VTFILAVLRIDAKPEGKPTMLRKVGEARLIAIGLRHGDSMDVVLADYERVTQHLLDPTSKFASRNLDGVLISLDYRALGFAGRNAARSWHSKCIASEP